VIDGFEEEGNLECTVERIGLSNSNCTILELSIYYKVVCCILCMQSLAQFLIDHSRLLIPISYSFCQAIQFGDAYTDSIFSISKIDLITFWARLRIRSHDTVSYKRRRHNDKAQYDANEEIRSTSPPRRGSRQRHLVHPIVLRQIYIVVARREAVRRRQRRRIVPYRLCAPGIIVVVRLRWLCG
jgi:hypothetical protein